MSAQYRFLGENLVPQYQDRRLLHKAGNQVTGWVKGERSKAGFAEWLSGCSGGEVVWCSPPEPTCYMWARVLAPLRLLIAGFFVAGFLLLLLVFPRGRLGLVAICNHLHF